jgi:hypothetical protein
MTGDFRVVAAAFLASLKDIGVLDGLISGGAVIAPWENRVALLTAIAAGETPQGEAKIVRKISANPVALEEHKAAVIAVMSKELFREAAAAGVTAIDRELRNGVAQTCDAIVLSELLAGVVAGGTLGTPEDDVRSLLQAVQRDSTQRLLFVVGANVRDALDALPDVMLPRALQRWPVIASDQLDTDTIVCVVAGSVAISDAGLNLEASRHADVVMNDDPDGASYSPPEPAQVTSMWQTDSIALRCERRFKIVKVRPNAVASVAGVSWTPGSP